MTIIDVTITYEASVREPRWAARKDLNVREVVPLEIADLCDADLPLTLDGDRPFRHDGRSWWRPLVGHDGGPVKYFPTASAGPWPDYPFSCPSPFDGSAHEPSDKADIRYSSRPGRVADAAREAADLCILEDRIWRRCAEPVIALSFAGPAMAGSFEIDVLPYDELEEDAAVFRLDQADEFAETMRELKSAGLGVRQRKPRLRVVREFAVSADLFALRARLIRRGLEEVISEFPFALTEVDDAEWQRTLDLADGDNDFEFLDALETAAAGANRDVRVALEYLTGHRLALIWRQAASDLEASRLAAALTL